MPCKMSITYIYEIFTMHSQTNVANFVATPQLQILRSLLYCQITVASGGKLPPFSPVSFKYSGHLTGENLIGEIRLNLALT